MAHLNVEGTTPKARAPLFPDSARSFPLRGLFAGADLDPKVAHFNGLAGANLATLAQLDLAVDADHTGAHQGFARASALADAEGLEQLEKLDVGFF